MKRHWHRMRRRHQRFISSRSVHVQNLTKRKTISEKRKAIFSKVVMSLNSILSICLTTCIVGLIYNQWLIAADIERFEISKINSVLSVVQTNYLSKNKEIFPNFVVFSSNSPIPPLRTTEILAVKVANETCLVGVEDFYSYYAKESEYRPNFAASNLIKKFKKMANVYLEHQYVEIEQGPLYVDLQNLDAMQLIYKFSEVILIDGHQSRHDSLKEDQSAYAGYVSLGQFEFVYAEQDSSVNRANCAKVNHLMESISDNY